MSDKFKEGIRYEVALEILGQCKQPFIQAIIDEKNRAKPSQPFINYCEARKRAIDNLQDDLWLADQETVERILDKADPVFTARC